MKQNLKQYFENNNKNKLDSQTKNFLYTKISRQIHKKSLIPHSFVSRSKLISIGFVVALSFSILQYTVTKSDVNEFLANLRTTQFAQADYIGSVVSWDWTYQIILNDKVVTQTDNRIPDGGSLIIQDGSKVSVKTSNNATADIVGPAKITFQKQNNQVVVDIAYSNHVDIKKDNLAMTNKENTKQNQDQNQELVVKTVTKTIVAKSNARDISLNKDGETNVIKNNNGEIAITSSTNNTIVALQSNESTILDDEVKLFAVEKDTKDTTDNKTTIIPLKDNVNNTSLIVSLNTTDTNPETDEEKTLLDYKILLSWRSNDEKVSTEKTLPDTKTSLAKIVTVESTTLTDEEKIMNSQMTNFNLLRENVNEKQVISGGENDSSHDVILTSKKLLTPQLLQLLNNLHASYYYYNEDISKVAITIKQLCDELKITCTQKDFKADLNKVNQKITEQFIITSEVKFVR